MADSSEPKPDPTQRTLETLHREIATLQEQSEVLLNSELRVVNEQISSIRREILIFETHRLELKSDSEKTLNTATIAAEKAVQAALAAAEKARDQQTIASQLATTKAEEASKEQMKQQGETFSAAIAGLNTGFNDVKSLLGELRAEKRASQENVTEHRAGNAQLIATASVVATLFGGVIGAAILKALGG